MMLKTIKFSFLLVGLLFGLSVFGGAYAAADKVIAIVNDHVITQSELDARLDALQQHLAQTSAFAPSKAKLRPQVLDELIDVELQLQLAARNNIKIGEDAVDQAVADVAKHSNITVAQLQSELQKQGVRYVDFRRQMRNNIILGNVAQSAVGRKITITDDEVEQFLKTAPAKMLRDAQAQQAQVLGYHCVDILIPLAESATPDDKAAAKTVALSVMDKVRRGAAIDEVLKAPDVAKTAATSNDLGWRRAQDLPSIFVESVVKLKPQEVAGPVTAPNGLHVIKLLEVRGGGEGGGGQQPPMKLTREEARSMLYRTKMEQAIKPWLRQLRATAYVKIVGEDKE